MGDDGPLLSNPADEGGESAPIRLREPVARHASPQRHARKAKLAGGALTIPMIPLEGRGDPFSLVIFAQASRRRADRALVDRRIAGVDERSLDDVLELADIAWPR